MAKPRDNWSALLNQQTHRMEMQYHPKIGHLHVPNVVTRLRGDRGAFFSKTNAAGFRSDHEFESAPGERPRILVFGDSFTAGQDCENRERYSERLGELLDAEVYNFGLSGSAPDQHLLIYEELARHIEADLIIVGVTVHNIERVKMKFRPSLDRMTGKTLLMPKPYFTLEGQTLQLHHVPVPRARSEIDMSNTRQFLDHQAAPSVVQHVSEIPVIRDIKRLLKKVGLMDRTRSLMYRATGVQMYDDYCDERSDGWQLLAAIIRRFNELSGDTPLMVVPLPTYHYVVDKLQPIFDPLFASLRDHGASLYVCEITDDLVKGRSLNDRKRINDGHYTAHGHLEIARLLARKINELGLLPKKNIDGIAADLHPANSDSTACHILGVAYDESDSAAVLLRDGSPIAVAREEHFTQVLDQGGYPALATNFCLEQAQVHEEELSAIVTEATSKIDESRPALVRAFDAAIHEWIESFDGNHEQVSKGSESYAQGPDFSDDEIFAFLDMYELPHERIEPENRATEIADLLMRGLTVCNFAGRMEYGLQPHGGRAVLVEASSAKAPDILRDFEVHDLTVATLGTDQGDAKILYTPLRMRDEPTALTPFDAYRVIMLREIDAAMLGNYLIFRDRQPASPSFE